MNEDIRGAMHRYSITTPSSFTIVTRHANSTAVERCDGSAIKYIHHHSRSIITSQLLLLLYYFFIYLLPYNKKQLKNNNKMTPFTI